MKQLQKAKVEQIARRIAKQYGEKYVPVRYEDRMNVKGYYGPRVFPGSHEEVHSNWIISWEECPGYEWSYRDDILNIVREVAPGFYPEAINHFSVGFYEA